MRTKLICSGLIGVVGLVSNATAQERPASDAVPFCQSRLGCFLSGVTLADGPAGAEGVPEPPKSTDPQQQRDKANQPTDAVATGTPTSRDASARPKADRSHPKTSPITIAVGDSESGRMQRLATVMPKGEIKIEKAARAPDADFLVSTAVGQDAKPATKLFSEQVHILASGNVHALADLKDKVVSFGPEKSDAQTIGRKTFAALNIPVKEVPLDSQNALDGLSTGDLDAVVIVGPQPIKQLQDLKAPTLHLISWPDDGRIPEGDVAATIDTALYPGLKGSGEQVRTIGVEAILEARNAHRPADKAFLTKLAQHSPALSKQGFDLLQADASGPEHQHVASTASH